MAWRLARLENGLRIALSLSLNHSVTFSHMSFMPFHRPLMMVLPALISQSFAPLNTSSTSWRILLTFSTTVFTPLATAPEALFHMATNWFTSRLPKSTIRLTAREINCWKELIIFVMNWLVAAISRALKESQFVTACTTKLMIAARTFTTAPMSSPIIAITGATAVIIVANTCTKPTIAGIRAPMTPISGEIISNASLVNTGISGATASKICCHAATICGRNGISCPKYCVTKSASMPTKSEKIGANC